MKIVINGIPWKIKFVNGANNNLRRYDGTYTVGMTDNKQKTIFLHNDLDDSFLYKVFCHELVHAFCFSYGLKFDIEEEERLADFIATYGKDIFDMTDEVIGHVLRKRSA